MERGWNRMRTFSLDSATLVRSDRSASLWVFAENNFWYWVDK
jgi:hypothetical protein